MLALVDEKTLAMNIALLIGGLVLAGAGFVSLVATITGIKCALWIRRRGKAEREFLARHRRADGERFPPFLEGVCGRCGKGDLRIYFVPNGEELCPPCYDRFWRGEPRAAQLADSSAVKQIACSAVGGQVRITPR